MPRGHQIYTPVAVKRPSWWASLSPGQKTDLVLGTIILGFLLTLAMMLPDPFLLTVPK
jgi:hypothetical protein